ncbi:MAG: DUF1778 domain-containing protein [Propionibacteriaceae bacterium]|jgi:uncharacterized protein (DUF1778 family)|nr:DUF1778 domain-containing protein [Propionibacteriaceae bacterium]
MSTPALKDERLALRVTRRQKRLIERAAAAKGETLTDFSVPALVDKAEQVLADRQRLVLNDEDWDAFNAALDHPAHVLPALQEFMRQPSVFA